MYTVHYMHNTTKLTCPQLISELLVRGSEEIVRGSSEVPSVRGRQGSLEGLVSRRQGSLEGIEEQISLCHLKEKSSESAFTISK